MKLIRRIALRRAPRQERAKATTDAIVEAAARVFAEDGLEAATTKRIAEVAGVSVGSLYQYFPDKQALITALFDRESARLQACLADLVGSLGTDDVPKIVRAYVVLTLDTFEQNRRLYEVLIEEVPRVAGLGPTQAVDHAAARGLRVLLELGRSRLAPRDLDVAALLLVRTLRYNTIALLREPLSDTRRQGFVDELTALLCAYLFAREAVWEDARIRQR